MNDSLDKRGGYVYINRDIKNREWYKDKYAMVVYENLLLSANWEDLGRIHYLTTYKAIMNEVGIEERFVEKALNRLESAGELTIVARDDCIEIIVNNYGELVKVNEKNIESEEK